MHRYKNDQSRAVVTKFIHHNRFSNSGAIVEFIYIDYQNYYLSLWLRQSRLKIKQRTVSEPCFATRRTMLRHRRKTVLFSLFSTKWVTSMCYLYYHLYYHTNYHTLPSLCQKRTHELPNCQRRTIMFSSLYMYIFDFYYLTVGNGKW